MSVSLAVRDGEDAITEQEKKMNMEWNMLLTPLAGFVLFGAVAYGLYRLGDILAPKLKDEGGKLAAIRVRRRCPGSEIPGEL